MTATELRPVAHLAPDADLAAAYRYLYDRLATSWAACSAGRAVALVLAEEEGPRVTELLAAVDEAERGGATVMRLDEVRGIVGRTAGEMGGAG